MAMNEGRKSQLQEGIWKIERYGVYETNGWSEDDSKDSQLLLILKNLTLMLMKDDILMELIPLSTNVRMVLKKDSLGIAVKYNERKMKKLRLKFAETHSFSGVLVARSCISVLKKYIPVENLSPKEVFTHTSTSQGSSLTVGLMEHVSQLMSVNLTEYYSGDSDFSSLYPLEDMIEICILDKNFPSFVAEINKVLLKKLNKMKD